MLAINGNIEVSIDVIYEPSRLGDTRAQLILSSSIGGDYICPLVGHCLAPKPQGPIIVKSGAPSSVSFKNVFSTSAVFNCIVDNPSFIVKPSETIPAKKTVSFSIGYKALPDKVPVPTTLVPANTKPTAQSKTGKLIVTNPNSNISWVYYLKFSNS
jgi:hydrocephalus-inducing protein